MVAGSRLEQDAESTSTVHDDCTVTACESRPGRFVFLESGNTDGWISTDLVVDLER